METNVKYIAVSRRDAEKLNLSVEFVAITIHDPCLEPAKIRGAKATLDLSFYDALPDSGLQCATIEDAHKILGFWRDYANLSLVAQCEAGCGRSHAVIAAILEIIGHPNASKVRQNGTYNRHLYGLLMEAYGKPVIEPLVSVVCRVKYHTDRLHAFMLSMERQRYTNWEVIAVSDGPFPPFVSGLPSHRFRTISADKKGCWGHGGRQQGIDAAAGEYIALANDDNYLTPGFIEQMVHALQENNRKAALCDFLSKYQGYQPVSPSPEVGSCDLACFMAHRSLFEKVKWEGMDFEADGRFISRLVQADGGQYAAANRVLVVKN